MAIPIMPQADEAWPIVRQRLASLERQLADVRARVVVGTVDSHDVLEKLWATLPQWIVQIEASATAVSPTILADYVRFVSGNPALDPVADWQGLKPAIQAVVDAIRADPELFVQSGPDAGKTTNITTDVAGERQPVVYTAGEMDYLIPLIDGCLAFLG
ncbi:MAG: hypothetical protein ACXABY_05360 [Candidatus Thorarchaeota archaeon]|jgi:hypothetical protein